MPIPRKKSLIDSSPRPEVVSLDEAMAAALRTVEIFRSLNVGHGTAEAAMILVYYKSIHGCYPETPEKVAQVVDDVSRLVMTYFGEEL